MKKVLFTLMCLAAILAASKSLKAQEVTITLNPGWTWISYLGTEPQGFATALGSFTPEVGDVIKSQWGNATYMANGQWKGSITQFYPGYGYMYKSTRAYPVSLTLTPQQPAPQVVVTTSEPTDITQNSAICGGNVASSSGDYVFVFLKGICWGTNPNPTFNDNYIEVGNGLGSFTVSMTELTPYTTFYVRAFAVTPTGTFYGEELSFVTLGGGYSGDYDYVDLGLPSGLLWATCNVGADVPEEYGDYFAWGETQPKITYNDSTYQYCIGTLNAITKYCGNSSYGYNGFTDNLSTLLPEDDAATTNWGVDWRTPTKEEWQELYYNTTVTWTTLNGVYGKLFTALNGNSLFLPNAGFRYESSLNDAGNQGYYWSSSLVTGTPSLAWISWTGNLIGYNGRSSGQPIRAVRSAQQNNIPMGAINGLFSVSDSLQVYFSQGNLQYQASTDTWRFADNQYDYIGDANRYVSSTYSGWIDLFGWGTSGYHDLSDPYNVNYQPWSTSYSIVNEDYNEYGYGPSTNMASPNLTSGSVNYDWGVYNPISNGGNIESQWRTLTVDEWYYVFNVRSTISDIRYAKANVNNVNGVILLPDDWDINIYCLSNTDTGNASYSSNIISASEWIALENSGAVFLPAAGYRNGTSVSHIGSWGDYWSASAGIISYEYNEYSSRYSYIVFFTDSHINTGTISYRSDGQSVRLVAPFEN